MKLHASITKHTALWIIGITLIGLIIPFFQLQNNIQDHPPAKQELVLKDAKGTPTDTLVIEHKAANVVGAHSIDLKRGDQQLKMVPSEWFFHWNPKMLIWIALIAMMISTAAGLIIPIGYEHYQLLKAFHFKWWTLLINATIIILIGILLGMSTHSSPYLFDVIEIMSNFQILLKDPLVIGDYIGFTLFIGLFALAGKLQISSAINGLKIQEDQAEVPEKELLSRFVQLSKSLKFFLNAVATLIAFSIVTTGMVQKAILAELKLEGLDLFPKEFIYAYGLLFTIFLALFYLPIYFQLRMAGTRLKQSILDARKEAAKKETDQNEKAPPTTTPIDLSSLELKESALNNLKVALSILAPILGSVLPNLLKF